MSILPVIVGFGGINAAGRSTFNHAHRRLVLDDIPTEDAIDTLLNLATMMRLLHYEDGKFIDQEGVECPREKVAERFGERIKSNTLIRKISPHYFDPDRVLFHKPVTMECVEDREFLFQLTEREMPNEIPESWIVEKIEDSSKYQIKVRGNFKTLIPDARKMLVQSAGQLPTGFDPGDFYKSRNHPMALKLAVYGASDAIMSMGIDWADIVKKVPPNKIGVYAASAMGQVDNDGSAGYARAPLLGKRPNTKQLPLAFPQMTADFINAYIIGNVGHTTGVVGACSTFVYNLYAGMLDIQSGKRRVAIIGASEGTLTPEVIEGYRVMSALAEDAQLLKLDQAKGITYVDHARACRPFAENCGFTIAESAQFVVLFDDALAIEMGAHIHGGVGSVFVNADGFKRSITQPGIGNYITLGKALASARNILGDKRLRNKTFVQAHGTGTPQNRVTESHVLNELAKAFHIEKWPVGAIKAYVGHSTGPAAGDQLNLSFGTWKYGIIPGIFSIDGIAEDVHHSNLLLQSQHHEVGPEAMDGLFVNSKGFGGNNGTAFITAPHYTQKMLAKRHGAKAIKEYLKKNESVEATAQKHEKNMTRGLSRPIYQFGKGVLEGEDLKITDKKIEVPGFDHPIDLDLPNIYEDMLEPKDL